MAKRRFVEISDSAQRKKKREDDPEKAEQVRQMWLKELRKIIGGWIVGSEATKRSEPDSERETSESVRPKRFRAQTCATTSPSHPDLIELVAPPRECPDSTVSEPSIVPEQLYYPIPRQPYIEMSSAEKLQKPTVSPSSVRVEMPIEENSVNTHVDSVPRNPFVPVDLPDPPFEPMVVEMTRSGRSRARVSGKQVTTTGCYLVIIFILWVIFRIISGESRFLSEDQIDVILVTISRNQRRMIIPLQM